MQLCLSHRTPTSNTHVMLVVKHHRVRRVFYGRQELSLQTVLIMTSVQRPCICSFSLFALNSEPLLKLSRSRTALLTTCIWCWRRVAWSKWVRRKECNGWVCSKNAVQIFHFLYRLCCVCVGPKGTVWASKIRVWEERCAVKSTVPKD